MMNIKHVAVALAALLPAGAMAQSGNTLLTPRQVNYNENLPGWYSHLTFMVGRSDWMDRVRLPDPHMYPGKRQIAFQTMGSPHDEHLQVKGKFAHLPAAIDSMFLPQWSTVSYTTSMFAPGWTLGANDIRYLTGPNERRWRIPSNGRKLATVLTLADGHHVGEVGLPDGALPLDTVTIKHNAGWPSAVIADDTLFRSARLTMQKGDIQHYVFDPYFRTWKLSYASYRPVSISSAKEFPVGPRTAVNMTPTQWNPYVEMPSKGTDRDRRVVQYSSDLKPISYVGLNIEADSIFQWKGRIPALPGDRLEFIYINDGGWGSGHWHPLHLPTHRIDLKDLPGGKLVRPNAAVTWITARTAATLTLPTAYGNVPRVVVQNTATRAMNVVGPGLSDQVLAGETVAYRAIDSSHWKRETHSIDIMFAVATRLGEVGSKAIALELMRESLTKTNEALDNSGANFRFREAGVREINVPSYLPTEVIPRWMADYQAASVIGDSGADGIFVGGVAQGCNGLYHSAPRKQFVVAMNLLCPTDLLREEMGKALGMKANGRQGVPVIGSGNKLPLYATPTRFVDDGSRAINPGQRDEVQHMNGVAAEVARYGYPR
ncbi:hypothetical protein CCR98_13530 [Stenotrophomonas sp. WZN-1]|uniref:hypothetical protein n=1 Tax=Stenotrophomonas sp. WZN-1 TaxID=2005046 RepID=UPI000B43ACD6|nr:hypothetical protein [Stenotrophomonas sp. WZN-1]ARZ75147.1 hypothetical protein CCR98_13530 [Stenotrophomonas sp. WZN-1]